MRLSVNKLDPGYQPDVYNYRIYIDGEELHFCITIDTELKMAIVYLVGDDGEIKIDPNNRKELLTGTLDLTGKAIEIIKETEQHVGKHLP